MSNRQHLRPFVVGLIGHREITESQSQELQVEFDNYLEEIMASLPNTPVLVITAIAEGADLLAHKSRLRHRIQICAVLPMPRRDYEKDFKSKLALREFSSAISDSDFVFEISGKERSRLLTPNSRRKAYSNCGKWISDHSNALFVVWDGNESRGIGGTSETVKHRQKTINSPAHLDRGGLSFTHAMTSNAGSLTKEVCDCGGHSGMNSRDRQELSEFDQLNFHLLDSKVIEFNSSLSNDFTLFDQEAVSLQNEYMKMTKVVLALGVITVNASSIHVDLLSLASLFPTLASLVITLLIWRKLTSRQVKTAYETFRLMAEVLRVQIWWRSCGLEKNVLESLPELRETGSATRLFLANTFLANEIGKLSDGHFDEGTIDPANWIEDQRNYLESKERKGAIHKNESRSRRLKKITYSSLATAVIALLLGTLIPFFAEFSLDNLQRITSVAFTASLSIAAATAAFSQAMGYREIAARYRIKEFRLEKALNLLSNSKSKVEKLQIAEQVGIDSLSESFKWFQVKSERQVRPFQ